ncbi:N-acetylneuraminate lyase [Habropoda laboriosa]|uniref:N-acetylneuraminate lyase n=2 Tax=Habropoda laboriosa TaxID=597456 RepID=A0A0L7RKK5_9HYME|nr:N-acetylneuraminate lyase [Habropoda laboriosa]
MSANERKLVAEAWADAVKTTKQHLMIQVGGAPLPDVLDLARHAESIKADSILCLPELYFKPTTVEQLTEYLKVVSSAAPNTPLLYYHIPSKTNVNLHMGEFLEYIGEQVPTFVGIKFTSSNLEEGALALRASKNKFTVFLGNDQLISAGCRLGMDSFITTGVNMLAELTLDTLKEGQTGDNATAREKQDMLTSSVVAISKHGDWVETMKVAMTLLTNINPGPPRTPLKPLSAQTTVSMATELQYLAKKFNVFRKEKGN